MEITDFITSVCVQTAVYWAAPTNTGTDLTFITPVEVKCRWEDKKVVYRATDGKEHISRSVVYVLQEMDEDGYLYLGELADLSTGEKADPRTLIDAFTVKQFNKSPSLGTEDDFIYTVYL